MARMDTFFDLTAKSAQGETVSLKQYKDKVILVVNVASHCGFTGQYAGLEDLYQKYKDRGLVIIGFPCNQFGGQEPGSDQEIQTFCQRNFGVTFPVMAKIDVNGDHADPVFKYLKEKAPGILGVSAIKWNFTKFLVDRDGNVVERFAPQAEPNKISPAIEKLLG